MAINTNTTVYGVIPTVSNKKRISSSIQKTYGFAYPLTKNLNAGWFSKESGIELIKNNLKQLLSTDLGERVLLPRYGLNLKKYLFQPMDEQLFETIKREILGTMSRYANNVTVLKLKVLPWDSYGLEGLQALQIILSVQLKESEGTVFEVGVKIG
jgi:phage baseplate assembly protein W